MLEHGRKMLLIVVLLVTSLPAWGEEKSNPLDQAPSQLRRIRPAKDPFVCMQGNAADDLLARAVPLSPVEFDVGKFDEDRMAFPPGVVIKDFQSDVSQGYPNPKPGGQPARFPTIIQIVPVPK